MILTENPPLPSPPFFTVPNLNNFRDAALHNGGLKTLEGKRVRPGVLFRSAEVSKLDREGLEAVKKIGVGHVFDLRSKPEVEKGWKGITNEGDSTKDVRAGWEEVMKSVGVERVWVPVFTEKDYSPERLAERYMKYMNESEEGFLQAYHDILLNAGPAFRPIFQYLAALPPPSSTSFPSSITATTTTPIGALIHCTAGKDRTGIFFAILLSYLRVPAPLIAAEYHLTEQGLSHIRDEIVARLMQSPGFKKYTLSQQEAGGQQQQLEGKDFAGEALRKGRMAAERMMSAREATMRGVLELVGREWGGAEGYLRGVVGLGDGELEGLRGALLVE
ncbi:hypothetical protein CC80DRAFT_477996 [Byssothecium circinans]|uniref:Tyrosine specific protein phosphatases domain-containing protein n=1 Tax=Byssothecium circinans TaxID=147558 RepID=A0A6A5TKL4_9PLEO|nr:hypothetical protein CC80DRAFT_477996 [Byssothecium circinans]